VPRGQGKCRVSVGTKISVQQLHVGPAHACGTDPDENLMGLDLGDPNIFQDERLVVTVHACGSHGRCSCVSDELMTMFRG
jgi:hypothetical protein